MKTTRRKFIRGAAIGSAGLALAMCTSTPTTTAPTSSGAAASATAAAAKAKRGGTIRLASSFDFGSLDPTTASGGNSNYWMQQAYARLLYTGTDLKLKPDLAERWEISSDQKTITFFLRKGVT